jgi:hypothetical protein
MSTCTRHSSRGNSRAYRLVLARHTFDRATGQRVVDEIGDCETCWHDVALAAVDVAANMLIGRYGVPDMDAHGNVTGPSVDMLLESIETLLRCEELDRRDLGRGP